MDAKEKKLIYLTGLFIVSIIVANTIGAKLVMFGPGIIMTAGTLAFPITFLVTDIINEVWGKKTAQRVVMAGLMANFVMLALYQIAIRLPAAPFWPFQAEYALVLGAVPRIVVASMVAYMISQTWDVWMFDKIKQTTRTGLWVRNNLSTFSSQAIDSAVFVLLAFGGVMSGERLLFMYLIQIGVKWLIALMDTPFCYWGVWWAKRGTQDGETAY